MKNLFLIKKILLHLLMMNLMVLKIYYWNLRKMDGPQNLMVITI